jgi:hypothetical protein
MAKPRIGRHEPAGRFGLNFVREVVENGWGCILHPIEGYADRGYDAIVFDQHEGQMTSRQFLVQIKCRSLRVTDSDRVRLPIGEKHAELWRESNLPVLVVLVNTAKVPVSASWALVNQTMHGKHLEFSRRNSFDPGARDAIIAAIQHASPKTMPPVSGAEPTWPVNIGIRNSAREYYRSLMRNPQPNPLFGPVQFTWKGWRHITRRQRSFAKLPISFSLLPSVRSILAPGIVPVRYRSQKAIRRGEWLEFRTLLVFERVVVFRHRAPTWARLTVERDARLPADWISAPPDDPRRRIVYRFLSLEELNRPVQLSDLETRPQSEPGCQSVRNAQQNRSSR